MATRCTSREEAEQTANEFLVDWPTPAVVEIRTEQGDLDTVHGVVEGIRVLR